MFDNISKIVYKKKSMLPSEEYFEIEVNVEESVIRYNDGSFDNNQIMSVNYEIVMNYFDKLFRIIDSWKEEYINNSIIDGIEWTLQIIYINGLEKQYIGKNGFPNNFEYLDKIKYEIINNI